MSCLSELEIGKKGIIQSLDLESGIKRRLLDLGLTKGTIVTCMMRSPLKDPTAYLVRGSLFAIRKEDASKIKIHRVNEYDEA